jgi:hypothetical protein
MDKNKGIRDQSSQKTEKNVNKVIRLKTPGTRRVQMKLELNEKKAALTASILSVVALASFFNQKIVSHFDSSKTSRNIASLNEQAEYEFQWQKELSEKLANKENRKVASFGEQPSKLDQIRFGMLEGKYAINFDNERISEIKFQETASADRPKYIPNVENFLIENKDVLIPNVSLVKTIDTKVVGEDSEQTLELYDSSNKALGQVTYVSDKSGRLRSMKFYQAKR